MHDTNEEQRRQIDPAGYCAHQRVNYDPINHGNGRFTSRWRCADCNIEFAPGNVIDRVVQNPRLEDLRDQFAMAALTATINWMQDSIDTCPEMARRCYIMADAMMEARKK